MHTDVDTPPIKPIQTLLRAKALERTHARRMGIHCEHRRIKAAGKHCVFSFQGVGMIPKVEEFLGVVRQIIKFSLVGSMVDYDLLIPGAKHRPIGISMSPGVVVFGVNLLSASQSFRSSLNHRQHAFPLDAFRNLKAGRIQKSRSEIHQLNETGDSPVLDHPTRRPTHNPQASPHDRT